MKQGHGRKARGHIWREIFAQVERMVAEQTLSRSEAFRRLAEKTGRRIGTVSANYYRAARRRGGWGSAGASGRRAAVKRVLLALRQVVKFVEEQEAELEQLRKARVRYLAIRRLLAGA